MCRVEDSEPWDFCRSVTRRARKQWRCAECRRTIAPGENYRYTAGRYDGEFADYHSCVHCDAASAWLQTACGGFVFTELLEELREHWDDEPELRSWTLGRLLVGIRRQWKQGTMAVPDQRAVRDSVPMAARS